MRPLLASGTQTLLVAALVAACGSRDNELFPGGLTGIVAIDVRPATAQIDVTDPANPGEVQLTATGTFLDGSQRDVTKLVRWATDPPFLGDVSEPGLWHPSVRAGGVATVAALAKDVAGSAAVTVTLHLVIDDPTAPIPEGTGTVFDPPTPVVVGDATHSPTIAYPAHETMFPIDVAPILFQHVGRGGTDVYRYHFLAPYLDVSILTTADRWQPDAMQWGMLALTAANGTVAMTVDAVDLQAPGTIWESTQVDLYYSQSAVGGLISYWSDATSGIFTTPLGGPATASYPVAPDRTCVGCHAVSRDGKRLAVSYNQMTLQEASLPDDATILDATARVDAAWITFSPDGTKVLVANKGRLSLRDAMTGMQLPMPGMPPIANATMPDWSPRGDAIALAQCGKPVDRNVETCSILTVGYDGTSFSPPQTLVPSASMTDNNYEPRYSPDGKWIAFVHASGASRDQATAEIQLIPAGGGPIRDLVRGNHRVGPLDAQANLANAMPAWAPATRPGVQWLVFSSTRDYGVVATGLKPEQLWIVAVDPRLTGDPSFAAFWFPVQNVTRRNHTPGWALDPTAACSADGEVCDGFDNDCDGIIDNDCRPCGLIDICGDGIDNDCDGLVDPGCIQ